MTNDPTPDTPRELPTFEGWTVDERLREFRRLEPEKAYDFVPFDSPVGQARLHRWLSQDKPSGP